MNLSLDDSRVVEAAAAALALITNLRDFEFDSSAAKSNVMAASVSRKSLARSILAIVVCVFVCCVVFFLFDVTLLSYIL